MATLIQAFVAKPILIMFSPPIGKLVVLPERVRKGHRQDEKHRCYQPGCYPQWQLVLHHPVMATCSELKFRTELTAALNPCLVPHQTVESYTEVSARRLGDTSRINSP